MSEVDIANGALDALGQDPILSFDAKGKVPGVMKRRYPIVRDSQLAMHPWNFAIQRLELPENAQAPTFGFHRAFTIPTDVLRLMTLHADGFSGAFSTASRRSRWQVEGRTLLANVAAPVRVRALMRITDTTLFPPLFTKALELHLAVDVAEGLTDSTSKKSAVSQLFRRYLAEAKGADAREGRPPKLDGSVWLDAHDLGGEHRDYRTIERA